MNIDKLEDMWHLDAHIDPTNLTTEALRVPVLHNRYYKILMEERNRLFILQQECDNTEVEKRHFYLYGPDEYSKAKGWKERPQGRVLKAELPPILAADADLNVIKLRIFIQEQKVLYIEEIIKQINNRSYHINNAIKNEYFKHGMNA